ncbi:MAG: glycosyltransferase [Candidatus Woesearchaeota archaeon]
MKVFIIDLVGCKPFEIGYQIKKTLENLGHETKSFNYRFFKLQHFKFSNKLLNEYMVFQATRYKPDLVLVNKGESILPKTIEKIKKIDCKAVSWNPDEPFGYLDSFNRIENVSEYDAYFTYDKQYLNPLKKLNKNVFHLPPGADPFEVHKEVMELEKRKFSADLCLVGTAYKNRIELLSKFSNYKLKLAGPKWDKAPKKLAEQALPRVSIREMVSMFNESKIVLNHYGESKYFIVPNPRTFEIPASRSFQLTNMSREVEDYFKPNKEIVVYKDEQEFKELVDYYLDDDQERNEIAQKGYERVLKEHTMENRIKKMLDVLDKI